MNDLQVLALPFHNHTTSATAAINTNTPYIRGVNLGGWLVLERYITPYTFAITDCHTRGDFCWHPHQIDAPPVDSDEYKLCPVTTHDTADSTVDDTPTLNYTDDTNDTNICEPVLSENVFGANDYPLDEWHLSAAFDGDRRPAGEDWLNSHFDHFLQKQDLVQIKESGMTHVRVPLPHWILGNIDHDNHEPWIAADRWHYFLRMTDWAREIGLEVWPNIHTAPGSQNGFDNSGVQLDGKTCENWSNHSHHIQRSLDVIQEVSAALLEADVSDVVTGFGLLNEPFGDCDKQKYRRFLDDGVTIIRETLGPDVGIYMSDLFQAKLFNDGVFGIVDMDGVEDDDDDDDLGDVDYAPQQLRDHSKNNNDKYINTYLDSHYYNIFSPFVRKMSPQEHMEHVCHPDEGESVTDCCYEDADTKTVPIRHGTQRIVAEWTGAFDSMPGEVLKPIMKGIYEYGVAPLLDRQLSPERKSFLKKFIQAQIVSYEAANVGGYDGANLARGWFYWNFKMEGGAYIEWDYLRGVEEGWFPTIAPPEVSSESLYGSCTEIQDRTTESAEDVIHTYPWIDREYWRGPLLVNQTDTIGPEPPTQDNSADTERHGLFSKISPHHGREILAILAVAVFFLLYRKCHPVSTKRLEYREITV